MIGVTLRSGWDQLRQRWLVVALMLFFGVIYTQYVLKLQHSDHNLRSAFLRWRSQLADLDAGANVWDKYAYPNPPIMALILKPFLQLPPTLGAVPLVWLQGIARVGGDPRRPFAARFRPDTLSALGQSRSQP